MNSVPQLENIRHYFAVLAKIGNLGPELADGFLRAGWSDEETAAMNAVGQLLEAENFSVGFDRVGTFSARYPKNWEGDVVQVASHLDTVPRGGLYDGGAGIVAGMEALRALSKSIPAKPSCGLELIIWRGEESSTFEAAYKGSMAAFGKLAPKMLDVRFQGQSLAEAMQSQGCDPEAIRCSEATISQARIDHIRAHVELHIEQATKLEIDGDDIGIVTSIRGPRRYRIVIRGEAAHSGATPMGRSYRKDANLAMAHMHVRLDEICQEARQKGWDIVQTVGVINSNRDLNEKYPEVYANALTIVSAFAYFQLDIRSNHAAWLDDYCDKALLLMNLTAEEFGVQIEIQKTSESLPLEKMDEELQNLAEQACRDLSLRAQRMPSGAGHDIAVVARQKRSDGSSIPALLLFIPCRKGVSHNPAEFATDEAVLKGAQVIASVLQAQMRD